MRCAVVLSRGAERDLEKIYDYIADADSYARADNLLDRLVNSFEKLSSNPARGSYPPELIALGIKEYRQIHFKPYCVIYRVFGSRVVVFLIADGRRDMRSLLTRRLLSS